MATLTASPVATGVVTPPKSERMHRLLLALGMVAAAVVILSLAIHGFPYYTLKLEERPFSPLHSQLRSSGTLGLRLGMMSLVMFGILFLYPLRKRWQWLSTIGSTRRWLNFHILFGVTTPCIVTFHTSFRFHGLAGLAYWTMIAVALSGFVGRYVYAKIPRSLNSVALTMADLESQSTALAERLQQQAIFRAQDLAPLLDVPGSNEIRRMGWMRTLTTLLRMDLTRMLLLARLRRRILTARQRTTTLGGLLPSHDRDLEAIVTLLRRQSRLQTATAFLDRTERIFHLWHIVHRPFSISFVVLIAVHIGVALSIGF
jgi:hypothetical protein